MRVLPWALGGAAVVIAADIAADLALRDEFRFLDASRDTGLDATLSLAAVTIGAIALALAVLRGAPHRARLGVAATRSAVATSAIRDATSVVAILDALDSAVAASGEPEVEAASGPPDLRVVELHGR